MKSATKEAERIIAESKPGDFIPWEKAKKMLASKRVPMKKPVIEFERETDGRWIADIPALPGAMVYGATKKEALAAVCELAEKVIGENIAELEEIKDMIARARGFDPQAGEPFRKRLPRKPKKAPSR
jgi:predicted RNase H-like HicB family nuclease